MPRRLRALIRVCVRPGRHIIPWHEVLPAQTQRLGRRYLHVDRSVRGGLCPLGHTERIRETCVRAACATAGRDLTCAVWCRHARVGCGITRGCGLCSSSRRTAAVCSAPTALPHNRMAGTRSSSTVRAWVSMRIRCPRTAPRAPASPLCRAGNGEPNDLLNASACVGLTAAGVRPGQSLSNSPARVPSVAVAGKHAAAQLSLLCAAFISACLSRLFLAVGRSSTATHVPP